MSCTGGARGAPSSPVPAPGRPAAAFCPGSVCELPLLLSETRARSPVRFASAGRAGAAPGVAGAAPGVAGTLPAPRHRRCPVSQRPRAAGAGPGQCWQPPG